MNELDVDRRIADWMEDGPSELPDGTRRAILVGAHVMPRRQGHRHRLGWLGRGAAGLVSVAVLALVLGLAGWALLLSVPRTGPAASPSPTPTRPPLLPLSVQHLGPGTHRLGDALTPGSPIERMTVTVPEGWSGIRAGGVANLIQETDDLRAGGDHTGSVLVSLPMDMFVNPCDTTAGLTEPPLGPTVEDFLIALQAVPGYEISAPSEVTLLGHRAFYVEEVGPPSVTECTEGFSHPWRTVNNASAQYNFDGQHDRLWIVDVESDRVVIDLVGETSLPTASGDDPADLGEQQQVFESIRIEPQPSATPSATPMS